MLSPGTARETQPIKMEPKLLLETLAWAHEKFPKGIKILGEFVLVLDPKNLVDRFRVEIHWGGMDPEEYARKGYWATHDRFFIGGDGTLNHSCGLMVPSTRDLNPFLEGLQELREREAQDLLSAQIAPGRVNAD